jgi:hypothetical protein
VDQNTGGKQPMALEQMLNELIENGELTSEGAIQMKIFIFDLPVTQQTMIGRDIIQLLKERIPREFRDGAY